jgi:hypothetical protein
MGTSKEFFPNKNLEIYNECLYKEDNGVGCGSIYVFTICGLCRIIASLYSTTDHVCYMDIHMLGKT